MTAYLTPEEIEAAVKYSREVIEACDEIGRTDFIETPFPLPHLKTLLSAVEQAQGMRNILAALSEIADEWPDEEADGNGVLIPLGLCRISRAALSSLPPDPLLVEARDAQNKSSDVVFQALVDAREYFAERADAEYFTDSPRAHGNTEMQLMSAMDEALAALNRTATGER